MSLLERSLRPFAFQAELGEFIYNFGAVEHQLRRNLAHLAGIRNFENFDAIADRMAADDVVRRVKKLGNGRIPDDVVQLINAFLKRDVPMRNNIVHNWLIAQGETVYCGKPGRMPDGTKIDARPNNILPEAYTLDLIKDRARSLQSLFLALDALAEVTWI